MSCQWTSTSLLSASICIAAGDCPRLLTHISKNYSDSGHARVVIDQVVVSHRLVLIAVIGCERMGRAAEKWCVATQTCVRVAAI
jgi:hypothetical protein